MYFIIVVLLVVSTCVDCKQFGRISKTEYILTPKQIQDFKTQGCCTLNDVLDEEEMIQIESIFQKFMNREIHVPGKDFCEFSWYPILSNGKPMMEYCSIANVLLTHFAQLFVHKR